MAGKKRTAAARPVKNTKSKALMAPTNAIIRDGEIIENSSGGLGEALGYVNFGTSGYPWNQGTPWSEQLSNVTTIFKNLRWYLISNFRQVLSEAYVELGLVQTICDLPVDDALRGGIEVQSKELDEDEIEELLVSMDRDDDLAHVAQSGKWLRLFGGAAVIIMTDQDPSTPLDLNAITKDDVLEFESADLWELFGDQQNVSTALDGADVPYMAEDSEYFDYYSIRLHRSRVIPMVGLKAPSFIRPRLRGWGYSVVEKLVRSINQYLKGSDLSFEVMDEFKLDVYKIKNLTNSLLSPAGRNKVKERVQLGNWQKNYQHALVMDKEDDYDHKQLSFSGLAEVKADIRLQVAADMRMPLTKLFGISAAGFNSGEDDIEVYNAMVENEVRGRLKAPVLKIVELKCQKLFGFIPSDLKIKFKPLRIMTSEQEENVKTQRFNRLIQAKQAGEITTFEFREGCNKDNLLSVTLDTAGDKLNPDDPEVEDLVSGQDDVNTETVDGNEGEDGEGKDSPNGIPKTKASKLNPKAAKPAKNTIDDAIKSLPIFTALQMLERSKAVVIKNSAAFDRASYAADGGDSWVNPKKAGFYESMPMGADKTLWQKAEQASVDSFGKKKWQFVLWWYKKQGGRFE